MQRVVLLGSRGVFGSRLAEQLRRRGGAAQLELLTPTRAELDRDDPSLRESLARLRPDVVVDAAGPFQDSHYRVVEASLDVGSHYLDLSDDVNFTVGISRFDERAREKGVAVISGASTVPGISSAVVAELRKDVGEVQEIYSAIMPGNRAPRGLSVMRAILKQVGHKGAWSTISRPPHGAFPTRLVSPIGAPDLELFDAPSVRFAAGLELKLFHIGLWLMSFPVRWGLVSSLEPAAPLIRRVAQLFLPFGTDEGGMTVVVKGSERTMMWTMSISGGDGPKVPTITALALLLRARHLVPGARACMEEVTLAEVEALLGELQSDTKVERVGPLFRRALGDTAYDSLPTEVRRLHDELGVWEGTVRVGGGRGVLVRALRNIFGFPEPGERSVRVELSERDGVETWRRTIDGSVFISHLRYAGDQHVYERFGVTEFKLKLGASAEGVTMEVQSGKLLGIPMPTALLPRSFARERSSEPNQFEFDVPVRVPLLGSLVHYQGRLFNRTKRATRSTSQ